MEIKSVREVVVTIENDDVTPYQRQQVEQAITQDRQHTKEVLMGRVREMKRKPWSDNYEEPYRDCRDHNAAIDQALQIIGEVFKSE